jgi:protease-4
MKPVRLGALALACALPAAGQQRFPTSGMQTPASSFALTDDATALDVNPAGLGFAEGLLLEYANARAFGAGLPGANGLFLSLGGGPITLGGSLEWLHGGADCTSATPCVRRSTFAGALRVGTVAIGASHHWFASGSGPTPQGAWDLGILVRPVRFLSLGYTVQDVNEPQLPVPGVVVPSGVSATQVLPRRHDAAIGVRPFGERVTLAVDALFRACTSSMPLIGGGNIGSNGSCGIGHPDWAFTGLGDLVQGVKLLAQVGVAESGTASWQLGVQIDFPHLGVATAPSFVGGNTGSELTVVRLSTQRWPGLTIPIGHAAMIDLDRALRRPGFEPLDLIFGRTHRDPLALTLEELQRLAGDGSVKAVVLRSGGLPLGNGRADELRSGIESLRAAGKKVLFYLESGGDLDYSVAAAADRVFAAPQAVLTVNGFSATALFAAAGLDKLGVRAEFVRVGAYKNAPDIFTRSDMSKEQREVTDALLDDLYGRYVRQVAQERHLDEGKFRQVLDRGLLDPADALREGLVDGLVYPDQLEEEVGKLLGGKVPMHRVSLEPPHVKDVRWGPRPRIGVVRVEGDIARGSGGSDPFGAVDIAGSDTIAQRIRSLADDPFVKAIVVRIDSPGGDGTASDLIWRELVRARVERGKPVVATMGDVAASGGYYVAVGADEIWAEPSTVTGSIGVFIGKFDLHELYSGLGLNLVTEKRGKSADLFSTARPLSGDERAMLQRWVETFYWQFVDRVAQSRKLSREQVDAIARGRVWSGAQAQQRGLVDKLGGFEDAVRSAAARAHVTGYELDDPGRANVGFRPIRLLPEQVRGVSERTLRAVALVGDPGEMRAALPFDLEVN